MIAGRREKNRSSSEGGEFVNVVSSGPDREGTGGL